MNIVVEIAKDFKNWNKYPEFNPGYFSETVHRIVVKYPNFSKVKEFELSILLTNDIKIQSLNNRFRGKDKPANVLSFPDMEIDWRKIVEFSVDIEYMYLGDIAFGYQVIAREAKLKLISFQDYFKHLLIHAILHLIGYDHKDDEEAQEMEALEIDILNSFGLASPY